MKYYEAPPSGIANIKAGIVYDENYSDEDYDRYFEQKYGAKILRAGVNWLNKTHDESKYIYAIDGYYGNDYSVNESYCELVILIVR